MSMLHILRSADVADAIAVIESQAGAGVELSVVLEGGQPSPAADLPLYSLDGSAGQAIDPAGLVDLIFAADTVVVW